jgi:lysophospholipase L1-like esterase
MSAPRHTRRRGAVGAGLVVVVLAVAAAVSLYPWSAAHGSKAPVAPARDPRPVPRVLGVRPDVLRGRGGIKVIVRGHGFSPQTRVTVGGRRARVLAVRTSSELVAIAPAGIGTEIVRATTGAGTSAANARAVLHYRTRVLVVGDSLGIDLGWGFTAALDARDTLTVIDDAVGSSGLVRNDFYDWPRHLRVDMAAARPDVVVTLFGTNDQQALATASGLAEPGTAAWDRAYAARVRAIAAIVHARGAWLDWVGLPRMGPGASMSASFVAGLVGLDRRTVGRLRAASFVDAWRRFTNAAGAYTPYVEVAPGIWELGHAPDGTHLTAAGAAVLDADALNLVRRALGPR